MSNVARKQLGLDPEQLRSKYRNEHLPSHDLHLGQDVIFQDSTSKQWFPATITSLVFRTKKLQDNYKRGCHIQENSSPFEVIHPTTQEE